MALESLDTGVANQHLAGVSAKDGTRKIPGGFTLSDVIGDAPTAHRAAVAAADTDTDMSSAGFGSTGLKAIDNRGSLTIWGTFSVASASCSFKAVYYDNAGAPFFVSEPLTLQAVTQRISAAGDYMSNVQQLDSCGAAKVKLFLVSISSGNVDLFCEPV